MCFFKSRHEQLLITQKGGFIRSLCFCLRAESLFECSPEVDVDLQSGEFVGPLQYRIWRKIGSILQPGI